MRLPSQRFAESVDVITYEFENVPAATAAFLAQRRAVYPGPLALEKTQDRLTEKSFLNDLGIATAPFAADRCRRRGRACPAGLWRRRYPEDAALRLRRQGPGDAPRPLASARGFRAPSEASPPFSRASSRLRGKSRSSARAGGTAPFAPMMSARIRMPITSSRAPKHRPRSPRQRPGAPVRSPAALPMRSPMSESSLSRCLLSSRPATRKIDRQRDRPARAQFRSLDDRRRGHLAIRAAYTRNLRVAARLDATPRPHRHGQSDRR